VAAWPAEREKYNQVSWFKRHQLRKALSRNLNKNPDSALRETIDLFEEQVKELKPHGPAPLDTLPALILVGSLLVLWLVLLLLRSRQVRRAAKGGPPAPLYQPALMGGLFGVPAAFWVHDQLFRSIPPEPGAVEPAPDLPVAPAVAQRQPGDEGTHDAPIG
jgi:hypothetical protein